MSPALLLMFVPAAVAPIDFDLRRVAGTQRCAARADADIVVCGRRMDGDRQRIRPEAERDPAKPLVAEVALPNGWKANVNASQVEFPGAVSQRAMVTLKIPF